MHHQLLAHLFIMLEEEVVLVILVEIMLEMAVLEAEETDQILEMALRELQILAVVVVVQYMDIQEVQVDLE